MAPRSPLTLPPAETTPTPQPPPPAIPTSPAPPAPAPAIDHHLANGHDTAAHPLHAERRRRRSASLLPPLPSPADLAEDAPGRVEIITVTVPPDVLPPLPATPDPVPSAETSTLGLTALRPTFPTSGSATFPTPAPATSPDTSRATSPATAPPSATPLAAWIPVAVLAVAMLVVFIVGMLVTH